MYHLLLALSIAFAPTVRPSSIPPINVDEIVVKHVAALGGIEKIHSLRSFVKRGWYQEGDFHLDTYTAQMRPFYRVIGDPVAHSLDQIHEGYDGGAWEYYPDPRIVVRTVGEAARATRNSAMFDDPLVDSAATGTILTLGDTTSFNGHAVYTMHVTLQGGFKEDILIDRQSFMIDGRWQIVPMHAFGARLKTYDVYEDYRPEGGIMMDHRDREVDSSSGKVLDEGGITSVEINPTLEPSFFSPPQWQLTPLQRMIARIYDEREDPGAIITTYRQFRELMDQTTPTGDAVDFVVYQCLKMGHARSAVVLLTANVVDNPRSARAHFGLGRALQASGDTPGARGEYRDALTIDPAYARARDALAALP